MSSDTPPKIVYISGSYPPIRDGVGYYLKKLTDHLSNKNFQIITSREADKSPHTMAVIANWGQGVAGQVSRVVRQESPRLIHMQYPSIKYGRTLGSTLLPLVLRRRFKHTPLVVTVHEYHDASWLGRKRVELLVRPVRTIIVSNRQDEDMLAKKYGHKKIYRIPIGVNIEPVKLSHAELGKYKTKYNPEGKKLLLTWGLLDENKGVDKLVGAMGWIKKDTKLLISSGYDPQNTYHQRLRSQIDTMGADIEWLGFLGDHDISALLQISDAVVLPFNQPVSLRRGSVLAALAHGKLVVTTGPSEDPELKHRQNCYLLENNNQTAIAAAIQELFDDSKLATLIATRARALAANFDWKEIAKKHEEIYRQLID